MRQALSKEEMKSLLQSMLLIRETEESFVSKIIDKTVNCPCHLYTGQEAIASGLCSFLEKTDMVFGTHRSHGHYLAMGGDLNKLVAEIYCKETGCCKGRGGSMHIVAPEVGFMGAAPIVAGTIPLALGASYAAKIKNSKSVAVSFFGDGATGEGVLWESMNIAAINKLPIIFVCENNLYSTHMSIKEVRNSSEIYKMAEPLKIKSARVDGNDVLEIAEISKNMIEYCREGNGPVFLEFMTYRMRGHVGPDDNIQGKRTDIRNSEEVENWKAKDPINKLIKTLKANDFITEQEVSNIHKSILSKIEQAHKNAKEACFPPGNIEEVKKYVYS